MVALDRWRSGSPLAGVSKLRDTDRAMDYRLNGGQDLPKIIGVQLMWSEPDTTWLPIYCGNNNSRWASTWYSRGVALVE
jgi:hypothetical protein